MTFLAPLFWLGALGAALPIVLHLLRRKPEDRVRFAAVQLLQSAPVEHTKRRRLRELLLLTLRVAALVLLAAAFARPFFASGEAVGATGVTIVALDTSLSMSGADRFANARQLAKDAIAGAPRSNLVSLVTFADTSRVVVPPTGDRGEATTAVDRATPGFGGTKYRAAVTAAVDQLRGRQGTLVIVTDEQASGLDADDRLTVPPALQVQLVDAGAAPPNLAVTSVRVTGDRLLATVRNTSDTPRDARVSVMIDDRAAGERVVPVGADQSAEISLELSAGATAVVAVDDPDGLDGDNRRYLPLRNAAALSPLVVTTSGDLEHDAFYVRAALAVDGADGRHTAVTGAAAKDLATAGASLADRSALVVLSTRGLDSRGRTVIGEYLRQGGGLFLANGPDVDAEVASEILGGASVVRFVPSDDPSSSQTTSRTARLSPFSLAPTDLRHPLFRAFAGSGAGLFGLVRFTRADRVVPAACHVLARFTTNEVALAECAISAGRALVFASDLDNRWNDFPRRSTFVPFLHEVLRYLASGRMPRDEYLVADVPPGIPATPGFAAVPAADVGQAPGRRVAVNVDPRESEPARLSDGELQAALVPTKASDAAQTEATLAAREQEERQHLWQYALMLMLAALAVESLLAARTA